MTGATAWTGVKRNMNDKDIRSRCACWSVDLPERPADFEAVRSCCAAKDCACRHRVLITVALMLVFAGIGVAIGMTGARGENSNNLATLRETHLRQLSHGAGK
jgi:hypothetical protein